MRLMHVLSEEVIAREKEAHAMDLKVCMREDAKRFKNDTEHEWYCARTVLRTWALALATTLAFLTLHFCIRNLP